MRVAAVDVGTNSVLLLVADVGGGGEVRVVSDLCRIERLGRGVDRTGVLDETNVGRTLEALREYAAAIREAGAERVAAVGTQALREAKNGDAFLGPAAEILGAPIEVIDGRREAELAFRAVMHSFPELRRGPVTVCDVGGGSTEFIVGRDGAIERLASLPIGSVRMSERFLRSDPATREETQALFSALDEALRAAPLAEGAPLVGTAGTVTTLAAVAIGLSPYDPDRVQGLRLARSEVERQLALYLQLSIAERARVRGMEPRRADVIPAGAAIVARTMARARADAIVVSDRGIRFGLLIETAARP